MSQMTPEGIASMASRVEANMLNREHLWLLMLEQRQVDAAASECELCSALMGAALFPGMTSMSGQETVAGVIDEHPHYKTVYVELFRLAAHVEPGAGCTRILPDVDRAFTASNIGYYRLAVHDGDNNALTWVDVGPMTPGSVLSSMAVMLEVSR